MDVSFEVVDHFQELVLTDSQVSQNSGPFFSIFPDVIEYCLGKVLDHVLSLSLTLSQIVFHHH